MEQATRMRICPICGNEFARTRRDRRYCSSACRVRNHRRKDIRPLQPAGPEVAVRAAHARLAWQRHQAQLPRLERSARLDLQASLQAQRLALQVSELLLAQAPEGPRVVTSALSTESVPARDLTAAEEAGVGAAFSADGRLFLVVLLGSSTLRGAG